MLTVAYLANEYPSAVEPYVGEEIEELRRRGVWVVAGSVWKPQGAASISADVVVASVDASIVGSALWLCIRRSERLAPLVGRVLFSGTEGPWQRLKALVHTFMGACYAVMLMGQEVEHIHVHHGYLGSWIAMTAARLLGVGFSMTLHGSDLLLHAAYLGVKLENCSFCLTVSEYNRRFILERYQHIDSRKILVARLGVDVPVGGVWTAPESTRQAELFTLVAVGRLHAVKNHEFLIRACAQLLALDVPFECQIAGEGPERRHLETLIRKCGVEQQVTLLGHVPREQMDSLYERADLVVLTSHSEGIPLVLMEAMARGKLVLAPAITGIPELVLPGKTGMLYEAGSISNFVEHLLFVHSMVQMQDISDSKMLPSHASSASRQLDWMRHAARVQVRHNFNRKKNLEMFAETFVQRAGLSSERVADENFVLQQI